MVDLAGLSGSRVTDRQVDRVSATTAGDNSGRPWTAGAVLTSVS